MHAQRLDWLDELARWFDSLARADRAQPVPNCPGWNVANVIAHIGYGAAVYWIGVASHRDDARYSITRAEAAVGDGAGGRIFAGVMTTLRMLLRAHEPGDPCRVVIGPQTYEGLARLAASEVAIHRLDCEDALGRARSMTTEQAVDALAWTVETWWPGLLSDDSDDEAPPAGRLTLAGDEEFSIGSGAGSARVSGPAVDVLAFAWGRPSEVVVDGDESIVAWWTGLTGRTTALDARS